MITQLFDFVQQCAEAISNALDVEVTIIDNKLIRIAGTGKYKKDVGQTIPDYFVSASVIKTGKSYFIDSKRENSICKKCKEYNTCDEKGHINIPISNGEEIFGAISILCVNEKQFDILLNKQDSLKKFLKNIAELLVSKFKEDEYIKQLELYNSQFEAIFSSMSDGVLLTNEEGIIINCSDAINKLIRHSKEKLIGHNVSNIFDDINIGQLKKNRRDSQFVEIKLKKRSQRYLSLISSIIIDDSFKGSVIVLMEDTKINSLIYSKMNSHQIFKFSDMLGESKAFLYAVELGKKAATFNSNILILGESGTGKELFARSIHNYKNSTIAPFIAINCAAIPESLLESELFGYEEGAFTGAKQAGKPGKFELANGGTIFLDEIGDMPLHLQAKILRVLQERTIERIGSIRPIPINVRIIAATNRNLSKMVENKGFREDLYYRLNVFQITIPSLRERSDDIPLLVNYFIKMYCDKFNIERKNIDSDALYIFMNYTWKGNIRELQNTIEYLCCISINESISKEDVKSKIQINSYNDNAILAKESNTVIVTPINELEKREILRALNLYGHSTVGKLQAAKALNIGKSTLYRKLKEYGLDC